MISTRTLSPRIVNEFRFGATTFYNNLAQELQHERDIHKEFGLGLFDPPPIGWGLPSIGIAGFSGSAPAPPSRSPAATRSFKRSTTCRGSAAAIR